MGDLTGRYARWAKKVALTLFGEPNKAFSNNEDWRYGSNGSLCVHVTGKRAGTFWDYENDEGGDLVDLVVREHGGSIAEARRWLDDLCGLGSEEMS